MNRLRTKVCELAKALNDEAAQFLAQHKDVSIAEVYKGKDMVYRFTMPCGTDADWEPCGDGWERPAATLDALTEWSKALEGITELLREERDELLESWVTCAVCGETWRRVDGVTSHKDLCEANATARDEAERWKALDVIASAAIESSDKAIERLLKENDALRLDMADARSERDSADHRVGLHKRAIADLRVEAVELRRAWWLNHGCPDVAAYGDDGEMQCSACLIDFKRAPVSDIKETIATARAKVEWLRDFARWALPDEQDESPAEFSDGWECTRCGQSVHISAEHERPEHGICGPCCTDIVTEMQERALAALGGEG